LVVFCHSPITRGAGYFLEVVGVHRFNIIETPECEYGAAKETVDHFLLNCELYDEERDALRRESARIDVTMGHAHPL
jgi:hypothetical protein